MSRFLRLVDRMEGPILAFVVFATHMACLVAGYLIGIMP